MSVNINKSTFQPIDRLAIALMLLLSLLIGLLILDGDAVKPTVKDFTWENKKVGANDTSFSLVFSRPMNTKSVEDNIKISPPLAGKISWAGRRMFYTLLTPAPYGTKYQVQLQNGRDEFSASEVNKRVMEPFTGKFSSRDRIILYIATNEKNRGQLVLYNLTNEQNYLLTPKDLVVLDYKPYPNGDKVLFSARTQDNLDPLSAKLYTVTTGIPPESGKEAQTAGKLDLMLDNKDYQLIKFDLSGDGKTIVIQRGNKNKPGDYGLWFMSANKDSVDNITPQLLKSQPGGDFMITPDSKAVAVAQGQGTAILPIQPDAMKPEDYLAQYGLVQAFSQDGTQAAMVKFNTDYTKQLFLVTNQGVQKPLLTTTGSIYKCQFDPASPTLYCLVTQLLPGTVYQEQPFVVAIDVKTAQQKELLQLPPDQRNIKISVSPDGLGLLLDQIVPQTDSTPASPATTLTADDGEPIATSSLWLMPLLPITDPASASIKPDQLPLYGYNPHWLQ